jgi:UDP-N-acetylmuramoyl-L-alanyl-D-glutamate--2,6-diaminopimelate ligase
MIFCRDLAELLNDLPEWPQLKLRDVELSGVIIEGITSDARKVQKGFIFVAIKGSVGDGHSYIEQAKANGASVIIYSDATLWVPSSHVIGIQVKDSRLALDKLAARFHGNPSESLYCVGVTGTNGKTSTAYISEYLLNSQNELTGVIGTIDHHVGAQKWVTGMTTPDPVDLQLRLSQMKELGAKAIAMEISSHALDQKRADSVNFDAAIFSNLTRDHLDYHKTMESYFLAKQRFFTELLENSRKENVCAIVNCDSKYGRTLRITERAELFTFGTSDADYCYKIEEVNFSGTSFKLWTPAGVTKGFLPMIGEHNVQNALGGLIAGVFRGHDLSSLLMALTGFPGVPGRLHSVPNQKGVHIFVDYAHTPDALENVLTSIQRVRSESKSSSKITTVFGCGGDRDPGKRPMMASMAERLSDHVIATSDNPRTEDPNVILNQVCTGFAKNNFKRITDRREAIAEAVKKAQPGDVVLIAGKGHEDYQIVGTEKLHFSDFEEAQAALI